MKRKEPEAPKLREGDTVTYHGRPVKIVELRTIRSPDTGTTADIVRVQDPRRGLRAMFRWQLEAGIGEKPEKAFAPDPDEAAFT